MFDPHHAKGSARPRKELGPRSTQPIRPGTLVRPLLTFQHMLCPLLALLVLVPMALGSPGNDLDEFHDCIFQCEQLTCYRNPYNMVQDEIWHEVVAQGREDEFEWHNYDPSWQFQPMPLPLHLKLLLWTCPSNCNYQCQRLVTKDRVRDGEEVLQFHGKWPFLRIWGIQEFASMIFSLGNLWVHYLGYERVSRAIDEVGATSRAVVTPQLRLLKVIAAVTMAAWVCSTVFHVRDFLVTERLDYYMAGLTVLSGFYGIGCRYLKLYLPSRRLGWLIFTGGCAYAYYYHVHRLETDWLYTYNMRANLTVGVLQYVFWALHCFGLYTKFYEEEQLNQHNLNHLHYLQPSRVVGYSFHSRSPKLYSLYPLLLCMIVIFGTALEIFDFAPVFYSLVDAHSLWHLVTIVPAFMGWYDWMVWDITENVYEDLSNEARIAELQKVKKTE